MIGALGGSDGMAIAGEARVWYDNALTDPAECLRQLIYSSFPARKQRGHSPPANAKDRSAVHRAQAVLPAL
jgi:hypothetical protein